MRYRTKERCGMERREKKRERERGARSAGWLRSKGRKYGSEFRVSRMIYRNLNPRGSRLTSSSSGITLSQDKRKRAACLSIFSPSTPEPRTGRGGALFGGGKTLKERKREGQGESEGENGFCPSLYPWRLSAATLFSGFRNI